jgi:hypothetical protein
VITARRVEEQRAEHLGRHPMAPHLPIEVRLPHVTLERFDESVGVVKAASEGLLAGRYRGADMQRAGEQVAIVFQQEARHLIRRRQPCGGAGGCAEVDANGGGNVAHSLASADGGAGALLGVD